MTCNLGRDLRNPCGFISPIIAGYQEEVSMIRIQNGLGLFLHQQTVENNSNEREGKLLVFSLFAHFGHNTGLCSSVQDNGLSLLCQAGNNSDCLAHRELVQPANSTCTPD